MAKVHALEVFVGIVILFFVISVIVNRYNEVSLVVSKVDGRRYIVRNLPDKQKAADTLGLLADNMQTLIMVHTSHHFLAVHF